MKISLFATVLLIAIPAFAEELKVYPDTDLKKYKAAGDERNYELNKAAKQYIDSKEKVRLLWKEIRDTCTSSLIRDFPGEDCTFKEGGVRWQRNAWNRC